MIQWRKVSLLTLLFFLLAWSLFSVPNARNEGSTNQTIQKSGQDSSKINNNQNQPTNVYTGTSGQPRNYSWILFLIILLAFGATAALIWLCFSKCKISLRDNSEILESRIKEIKESLSTNPKNADDSPEKLEKGNQPHESGAEKELSSLKAEISNLEAKLEELRRSLDPDYLSLKISELIESNLTKNMQQFRSSLDKLGPELKDIMRLQDRNPAISPVNAVQEQQRPRPEPPVQPTQTDYPAKINQEFQSWLQANSLTQHFFIEYKQNGLTYLGIAPRRNCEPFKDLAHDFKAYGNNDFHEVRTESGPNAGHVKAVDKPAIIMIRNGIPETKQKGSYTLVKRG